MSTPAHGIRWAVNGARTITIPSSATGVLASEIDHALTGAHFRIRPHSGVDGVLRAYERGSAIGDVLIGGSGLAAITRRVGPLSVRGAIVLWAGASTGGHSRAIISLVAGSHIGGDFVDAVDRALDAITRQGLPVQDDGWSRAVDVPAELPANPGRARELGLA